MLTAGLLVQELFALLLGIMFGLMDLLRMLLPFPFGVFLQLVELPAPGTTGPSAQPADAR
jgi:hypothetical protein